MPRWFWIALASALSVAAVSVALSVPDPAGAVVGTLAEGGMWTGLAVFIVAAAVLGCWPRNPDGTLRGPGSARGPRP